MALGFEWHPQENGNAILLGIPGECWPTEYAKYANRVGVFTRGADFEGKIMSFLLVLLCLCCIQCIVA